MGFIAGKLIACPEGLAVHVEDAALALVMDDDGIVLPHGKALGRTLHLDTVGGPICKINYEFGLQGRVKPA